jgi:hypothetical protein
VLEAGIALKQIVKRMKEKFKFTLNSKHLALVVVRKFQMKSITSGALRYD